MLYGSLARRSCLPACLPACWVVQMMDIGSVHERSTAIFTVTLAQYAPAAVHGEEDRIMVSGQHGVEPAPLCSRLEVPSAVLQCLRTQWQQGTLNINVTTSFAMTAGPTW